MTNNISNSDLSRRLDLPEKGNTELYWELRRLGARPMQARCLEKEIAKLEQGKVTELSTGMIYQDMRKIGIPPMESLKIQLLFWREQDRITTSYEAGMIQWLEGKKKNKRTYNQIPIGVYLT